MVKHYIFLGSLFIVLAFLLIGCRSIPSQPPTEAPFHQSTPYIKTDANERYSDFITMNESFLETSDDYQYFTTVNVKAPYWKNQGFSLTLSHSYQWGGINMKETDLTQLGDGSGPLHYVEYKFPAQHEVVNHYFTIRVSDVKSKDEILNTGNSNYLAENDQYLFHYHYDRSECAKNAFYTDYIERFCNEDELNKIEDEIKSMLSTFTLFDESNPPESNTQGKMTLRRSFGREKDGSITIHLHESNFIDFALTFPLSWHIPRITIIDLTACGMGCESRGEPQELLQYRFTGDHPYKTHNFSINVGNVKSKDYLLSNQLPNFKTRYIAENDKYFFHYRPQLSSCSLKLTYKKDLKEQLCSEEAMQEIENEINAIISTFKLP